MRRRQCQGVPPSSLGALLDRVGGLDWPIPDCVERVALDFQSRDKTSRSEGLERFPSDQAKVQPSPREMVERPVGEEYMSEAATPEAIFESSAVAQHGPVSEHVVLNYSVAQVESLALEQHQDSVRAR